MNQDNDYNPWDHGPEAKFWECLRRNQFFAEALQWAQSSHPKSIPSPAYGDHGLVARIAMANSNVESLLRCRWTELPDQLRLVLTQVLCMRATVKEVPTNGVANGVSLELRLQHMAENHLLVAIPPAFDKDHQKRMLADLKKRMELRLLNQNEHLHQRGSAFGAKMQWHNFLLVEELSAKVARGKAILIVAWAKREPDLFAQARRDPLGPTASRLANRRAKTQSDYIADCVRTIEKHRDDIWESLASLTDS